MSSVAETTQGTAAVAGPPATGHFAKMAGVWFVLSVVGDLLFWFVAGPHMPPGRMSSSGSGSAVDFTILLVIALPVMIAVWVYMAYAIVVWRAKPGVPEPVGGAAARGHMPTQIAFIATTTVIVLALFVFGTVELITTAGSGGGEGPTPIWTPTSKSVLQIQVIAQQWRFTYRYPSFGGFETPNLVLPDDTTVEFHVTSLDVTHDFWAYQLGVKADANPSEDNVAYTTTQQVGYFTVRCDELCGIWHGAMYDTGQIMPKAGFESWATSNETQLAALTKTLPAYAFTYVPDANGADGGFYPDCASPTSTVNCDPYSNIQTYGAQSPKK